MCVRAVCGLGDDFMRDNSLGVMLTINGKKTIEWKMCPSKMELDLKSAINWYKIRKGKH